MSNYGRQNPPRRALPITIIACEGETEEAYFDAIRNKLRKSRDLIQLVREGTAPISVVDKAIGTRDHLKRNGQWRSNDTTWAVFDGEEHRQTTGQRQSWNTAIQRAQSKDVRLANSNPSFELWLFLHHGDQRATIHRDAVLKKLEKEDSEYRKGPDDVRRYGGLPPDDTKYLAARKRAEHLDRLNQADETADRNPVTSVHILVEHLLNKYGNPT